MDCTSALTHALTGLRVFFYNISERPKCGYFGISLLSLAVNAIGCIPMGRFLAAHEPGLLALIPQCHI